MLVPVTAEFNLLSCATQDNLDYENKMNGVLSEASDREGENLLRQVKRATKYAGAHLPRTLLRPRARLA